MYDAGDPEIDAIAQVIRDRKLFRYGGASGGQCERFERRWAEHLGVPHCCQTSSGTAALTAALAGLGIGPGDEVIVPAHTYMATALAVLSVGAIPVIVDVDDTATIDPQAVEAALTDDVAAVIPVHMWGVPCDMDAIEAIARDRGLKVVEDACQAVGGSYRGRMLGGIGDAGAFSFNYYKNITCGEGGAVVAHDEAVFDRARCAVDPCAYYWNGRTPGAEPFAASGSRASEIEGAMLNAQLDRLPGFIDTLRERRRTLGDAAESAGLRVAPSHDADGDCGANLMLLTDAADEADALAQRVGGEVLLKTGRHTYHEWDPILQRRGGHHPAMDPFRLPQNRHLRSTYRPDMLPRSLDLLARGVRVPVPYDQDGGGVAGLCDKLDAATTPATAG